MTTPTQEPADDSGPEIPAGRRLDWMCIDLEKDGEYPEAAFYFFSTTIWDKDPRYRSRTMFVGITRGLLKVDKVSGKIHLLHPMHEDTEERISRRACQKLLEHWRKGEYPERMTYACG